MRQKLAELLSEVLSRDPLELTPAFALTRQNGVELIDLAKLAIACEETWGIALCDEDVAQWRTLDDTAQLIARLLEAGEAAPIERQESERTAWFYE
jgi:acyl carrier protein